MFVYGGQFGAGDKRKDVNPVKGETGAMHAIQIKAISTQKRERNLSAVTLLFLLCGVFGLLSLLDAIAGVSFSELLIYSLAVFFCLVLWLGYTRRRLCLLGVLLSVLAVAFYVFVHVDQLLDQLQYIRACLSGEPDLLPMQITQLALVASCLFPLLLFSLEFLLKGHEVLYLMTTALLLFSPLLQIRITAATLLFFMLFQISFWIIHAQSKAGTDKSAMRIARQSSTVVCILLVIAFAVLTPVVSNYSQRFYDAAYAAEGFVINSASNLSGRSAQPITGGTVSSGNNYRTGTAHLVLTASEQPTETIYLRGFGGGEYIGGDWIRSSDEELFERMQNIQSQQDWSFRINTMYYSMYYVMNSNMVSDDLPEPISLTIQHYGGDYENAYVPYYSSRQSRFNNAYYDDTFYESNGAYDGYTYQYYEQTDMNIDWENITEEFQEQRDMYLQLQEAYMAEIESAYIVVPTELLPRLTALVQENPLTELNDITAFILYTLHSNATYSLTPGWAPVNEDIVENFLFERKAGYCQHFAAAATLMYRLYGIPARYATGYVVSASDFQHGDDGSWHADVTDEAAHAWVEIFLPEYGWSPVEVTPAADGSTIASYPGLDTSMLLQQIEENGWDMSTPSLSAQTATASDDQSDGADRNYEFLPEIEIDFTKYRDLYLIVGSCMLYTLLLTPFILDYRRMRKLQKMENWSCRMVFAHLLEALHSCSILNGYDGTEPDFASRLSQELSVISLEETTALVAVVSRAAYGPNGETKQDSDYVRKLYRTCTHAAYSTQNKRKKWMLKYIKAFL